MLITASFRRGRVAVAGRQRAIRAWSDGATTTSCTLRERQSLAASLLVKLPCGGVFIKPPAAPAAFPPADQAANTAELVGSFSIHISGHGPGLRPRRRERLQRKRMAKGPIARTFMRMLWRLVPSAEGPSLLLEQPPPEYSSFPSPMSPASMSGRAPLPPRSAGPLLAPTVLTATLP
mmetsp:Transcript_16277/g.44152  ORF Transcript_16277/g.44152 Transcript_16277/m.44152 type:complete len:177 (+) Transcript_16277:2707-3237(+)